MPIQFSAKLNAFSRGPRGFFVKLEVSPDDDWESLARAPLGTAFGVAMIPFDPETGRRVEASPGGSQPSALPAGQQRDEAGKSRKHWAEISRSQQAGILCSDQRFQLWLSQKMPSTEPRDCADALRSYLGVKSRAMLDDGLHDRAALKFDELVTSYRADTGQMAEQR